MATSAVRLFFNRRRIHKKNPTTMVTFKMVSIVFLSIMEASVYAASFSNMNGKYVLSQTSGAPQNKSFPTDFADYPGGVEYFEVYHGPIKTVYSEVFWKSFANSLPDHIVNRFDNKGMAIIGVEMDQVIKGSTSQNDISVPITCAYNHHHDTAIVGKGAKMKVFNKTDSFVLRNKKDGRRHYVRLDMDEVWVPVEDSAISTGLPTSAMFSDGNGGEYRKTLHAYAPPFAQIVESPRELAGAPMQIDTWNRDEMNLTSGGRPFVPGPYPNNNLAPLDGPDAIYSGLLECPLTTRIKKIFNPGSEDFKNSYHVQVAMPCDHLVKSSKDCFATARKILIDTYSIIGNASIYNKTIASSYKYPPGCSIKRSKRRGRKNIVVFNKDSTSLASCGAKSSATSEINGIANSLVSTGLLISGTNSTVTITLEGPNATWFGVGFNASLMADTPYTLIVDGEGNVEERRLQNHGAGKILAPSIEIISNTLKNGYRKVVLQRPMHIASKDYYSFTSTELSIHLINAVGSGPTLSYHRASTATVLNLWPIGGSVCLCMNPATPFGQGSGMLKYIETGQTVGFPANRCSPHPRGQLISQRNPTCDLRTYSGGLSSCHHGWKLLDAEQEIPWLDQPLEYYKKFRVYFQEYNASFHKQIERRDWGIAADGDHAEYDVPQCRHGMECTHTITGTWMPVPPSEEEMYLVKVHHHCHAPTCIRMELFNNDTGELICGAEPLYGGTDKIDVERFDEPGYLAIPPCLWGSPEHGLESPPLMTGVTIHVVAVTNNTYGHHGEMALPEISLVKGPL